MLSILERCPSCGALMMTGRRRCRRCRAQVRTGDAPVAVANLTASQALFAAMWYMQGFRG